MTPLMPWVFIQSNFRSKSFTLNVLGTFLNEPQVKMIVNVSFCLLVRLNLFIGVNFAEVRGPWKIVEYCLYIWYWVFLVHGFAIEMHFQNLSSPLLV